MSHLLIEKAFKYKIPDHNDSDAPHVYCAAKGFWIDSESNTPSIKSIGFRPAETKKCDIETGEDKKGE